MNDFSNEDYNPFVYDPDGSSTSEQERAHWAATRLKRLIPAHYLERSVTATHSEVVAWAEGVAQGHLSKAWTAAGRRARFQDRELSGPSLLLLGPTGVGKTFEAYGALRLLIETRGAPGSIMATTAADLYARLRPRDRVDPEAEFERFATASVLMLDDLGAAKMTDWTEEVTARLIDHRYNGVRATVITSNLTPANLESTFGERVVSRLTEMCTVVALKGDDRRRSPA